MPSPRTSDPLLTLLAVGATLALVAAAAFIGTRFSGGDPVSPAPAFHAKDALDLLHDPEALVRGSATYTQLGCNLCHGARLEGGTGPCLADDLWLKGGTPEDIRHSIDEGSPAKGMPPFAGRVIGEDQQALIAFILSCKGSVATPRVVKRQLAGQGGFYGMQALRANQSEKPFCRTESGRENHRFADADVNQYRIYDFYARQARYHLEHPEDKPALLMPFTELDGGRLGHWGVTNEPATTALRHETSKETYSGLVERANADLQAIGVGPADHRGVLDFSANGDLRAVLPDGQIVAPGNSLMGTAIDTLGLDLKAVGNRFLVCAAPEWRLAGKNDNASRYAGHYWHGDQATYLKRVGGARLLDHPTLFYCDASAVFARHIEWLEPGPAVEFQLPAVDAIAPALSSKPGPDGSLLLSQPVPNGHLHHLIRQDGSVRLKIEAGLASGRLSLTGADNGACLHILSWVDADPTGTTLTERLLALPPIRPSGFTRGGTQRFAETIQVTGKRNADPAARAGAYAIDDIPVPTQNPWNAPMCLSGIAFDPAGVAYVCTLTGDVWRVTGLTDDLAQVTWKRYANGLAQPMGMLFADGQLCVCTARRIVRLRDLDGDHEADFVEALNQVDLPARSPGAARNGLGRDASGNFYFSVPAGIFRLSADGAEVARIGGPMRNPLGLGTRADGLCLSDSSEGDNQNGTCSICESAHPENSQSPDPRKRVLFLPRGIDNSPGSRLFVDEPRFGPLGQSLIGLSYGACSYYAILRDPNDGAAQAALVPMPGDLASGMLQMQINPADGQLYMVGIDGWGDYAVTEGALHRVRWTGQPALLPTAWQAHANGIAIHFSAPLPAVLPAPDRFFIQQWNNIDSTHTYGSPDYSVRKPGEIGHDRLHVKAVHRLPDGRSLFLEIPELLPAMSTQIYAEWPGPGGAPPLDMYATLQRLRPDFPGAGASPPGKVLTLTVPTRETNGNTYQNILEYFDRAAGRDSATRPVADAVPYTQDELNYGWIKRNLIDKQCITCHGPGSQHDFSTYAALMTKVNRDFPKQSHLFGMIGTQSMPPYPLPSVSPKMQQAVLEWIEGGAKE